MTRRTQLPDKLFFKIGEVADIVGVKPHALRYWETEFPALRPKRRVAPIASTVAGMSSLRC